MNIINISKPETLIDILENLSQQNKSFIFRGQPSSNFFLFPNAFRPDGIKKLSHEFPASHYEEWYLSKEVKEWVALLLNEQFINSPFVRRIFELTIYVMQYNHSLAKCVQKNPEKFDSATLKMYELRPPNYWKEKETFLYLFYHGLNQVVGCVDLDGKVLKYSTVDETLAGYDDTLPQHYGIPTAALDWTYNPYIAIYFALQNIPSETKHISIYAYKEICNSNANPIIIEHGHPECKNLRIVRQEGTFTRIRYACFYYFINGIWPYIEKYVHLSPHNFELIKYNISISHINYLKDLLDLKKINEDYLFPDF